MSMKQFAELVEKNGTGTVVWEAHSRITHKTEAATMNPTILFRDGKKIDGIPDVDLFGMFQQCRHTGHNMLKCMCDEHRHDIGPTDLELIETTWDNELFIPANNEDDTHSYVQVSEQRKFEKFVNPQEEEIIPPSDMEIAQRINQYRENVINGKTVFPDLTEEEFADKIFHAISSGLMKIETNGKTTQGKTLRQK